MPATLDLLRTAAAAAVGIGMALVTPALLRRLPEPSADELAAEVDGAAKVRYASLISRRTVVGTALAAAGAAAVGLALLPAAVQPLWLVLATVGVLCAVVDGRTTWLPNRLVHAGWALMAVAVVVATVWRPELPALLRTLAGALAAGALYLLVWRITRGGFGFADVRFAPLVGAAAASGSWTLLLWSLVLGTVVGGVVGVLRLVQRRRDPFGYVPSILTGGYLAAVLLWLTGG